MPHAEVRGIRLHYEEEGHGTPVVLVHGGLGSSEDWQHQASVLARRHRVLRPDLRGHGKSTRFGEPGNPWSALDVETFTDDLAAFLEAVLPEDRVHLVGASMGSLLCQRLATEAPKRFRSLTCVASPPVVSEALRQFLRKGRAAPPPPAVADQYARVHGEPYWRDLRDRLLGTLAEMPEDVYPQSLLRGFKGPAWVVEASDDPTYSPVSTAFWYAWLPQARLDRPTGGHWLYKDGGAGTAWFNEGLQRLLQEADHA
ncbi:MAG TPA: alpha/beta hydrolase [Candidatus Thermoplasmatota archaeon]|nr:alpha/beta hydrolase [Candidatus Thermoplasmatota archaeon]